MDNVRYDDVVHAGTDNPYGRPWPSPVCGNALIPACEPESTSDAVTCWECEAICG